ncbi:MAG: FtsX-like permease family protein [Fibrobacter sp.]|nr:FtsX-like permease family protein [Fibrobacter sp.]
MNVLVNISLRNLVRQKRRNLLLGIAIAFGMMILIVAHGFSHGISDNLFNKIVVYVSGHLNISFSENGNLYKQVFHDGPRIKEIIKKEIPDVIMIQEALGIFSRAIGNGKSDNVIMVAIDMSQTGIDKKADAQAEENFKMIDGDFNALTNKAVENPVLISKEKADYLHLKRGDILRVRYRTITGQDQAARLTVAGIFKPPNMFMSAPIFLELTDLKRLMGYGPNDVGQLYITIDNPKINAIPYADKLQKALVPSIVQIDGTIKNGAAETPVNVFGFKTDTTSRYKLAEILSLGKRLEKNEGLISDSLASVLKLKAGDYLFISYLPKYGDKSSTVSFKITHIFKNSEKIPSNTIFINDRDFYSSVYSDWPRSSTGFTINKDNPFYDLVSQEWTLLSRARTTEELTKMMKDVAKKQYKGTVMDVRTMYESASQVLQLEGALNLITFVAVMLLFFIILIGVVNTLRMTVRERTREIGTIRAIGMQKKDVQLTFILETFFLALFSSGIGVIAGFIVMKLLSLIKINADGNPLGMLLVNERLYFVPTITNTVLYMILILTIAVVTAYFPSRKAAALSAADALRHYE